MEPTPGSDWLNAVAKTYTGLRTATIVPMQSVSLDEISVVDVKQIEQRLKAASIPKRNKAKGNFDVLRSDFGEAVSFMILRDKHAMRLVYTGIRDRELVNIPGRGPDCFGVEDGDKITIVIGEVKVTTDEKCPPGVVETAKDCLRVQHVDHMKDLSKTSDKLWHMSRHCRDIETQRLAHTALLYLDYGQLSKIRIVAFSLLVRQKNHYKPADFGTFKSSPATFQPADVRFVTFCVPMAIEELIDQWDAVLEGGLQ